MQYRESTTSLDTPRKILKVNHAGEFGAINIYKSQILVSKVLYRDYVNTLEGFLEDERRHLAVFWEEIQQRGGVKCKSYWLCGAGGYVMGFISALFGRRGIMACTWAVESVVTKHLYNQLSYLQSKEDVAANTAVQSILEDEEHHRDTGSSEVGKSILYTPFRFLISGFTEGIIRFGMR
jgi:ubiquinone biosynthesis monooxygenase Coq7